MNDGEIVCLDAKKAWEFLKPRHYDNDKQGEYRVLRTAKHRYVYFATNNKHQKKEWMKSFNYPILPYPKSQNQNYILGDYQKPILIKRKEEENE